MRESFLSPSNFILPLFIHEEGSNNIPIASMPGVNRLAYGKNVTDFVAEARSYGVNSVVIFPKARTASVAAPLKDILTHPDACANDVHAAWCCRQGMHPCSCTRTRWLQLAFIVLHAVTAAA